LKKRCTTEDTESTEDTEVTEDTKITEEVVLLFSVNSVPSVVRFF